MMARVLCVDDEVRVLEGLELHLGLEHDLDTANSGKAGLKAVRERGPFDVVISDMRMPGMDGAEFLSHVRQESPDSMRILLTGHADMSAALRAINEGQICRFLTKPCPPEILLQSVAEATELKRLRIAERELLEHTVKGCVEVLSEVLGVAAPLAFRHAHRLRTVVMRIAPAFGVSGQELWQLEVAALLRRLGCIALPTDLLERVEANQELSDNEHTMFNQVPEIGSRLLSKVPRLEEVASLVKHAKPELDGRQSDAKLRALGVALWLDQETSRGRKWETARIRVKNALGPEVAALLGREPAGLAGEIRAVHARELHKGMHICEDVLTLSGQVVVKKGASVSGALAARLKTFAENVGLVEPIRVRWSLHQ